MIQKDILYRSDAEAEDDYIRQQCQLDLYLPETVSSGFPLLVWFHGGGLTGSSRQESEPLSQRFPQHGVAVANADYRLGPHVPFPAYLEDAAAAVAWAVTEGVRRGADPKAIFVGGHSAGAYLAAMLAMNPAFLQAAGVPDSSIAGFLPISGQLVTHFHVRAERGIPQERLVIDDAAPLYYVRKEAPPILLLVGDQDMAARREEAALFVAAMTGLAGNTTTSLFVIPNRDHGTVHELLLTPDDPGGPKMLEFIQQYR